MHGVMRLVFGCRAVALARLPPSTVQSGEWFAAGLVSVHSGRERNSIGGGSEDQWAGEGDEEHVFKLVVVTQRRQLFR